MEVKIKKKGKVKEFKVIEKWSDVTLEKWVKLLNFKNITKSEEAEETISTLSNIPKQLINQLELKHVALIMERLSEIQANKTGTLRRVIEIEGKKYGFHPDLDSITLGEYADIESFIKKGMNQHMPELMAILYRPVVEEAGNGIYTIEAYDGNIAIRAEQMKKMSAEEVQSALVFFYSFVKVLLMILQSSLMKQMKQMNKQ